MNLLTQMAMTGKFFSDSLVWKAGMSAWERAGSVDILKGIFLNLMPPIPKA